MSLRQALVLPKYGLDLARLALGPRALSTRPFSSSGSRWFQAIYSTCSKEVPKSYFQFYQHRSAADAPTHTGQQWEDNVSIPSTGKKSSMTDAKKSLGHSERPLFCDRRWKAGLNQVDKKLRWVGQRAGTSEWRFTKIFVLDKNCDPQHTLFCRKLHI